MLIDGYHAGMEYSNGLESYLDAQGSLSLRQAAHIELRMDHLINPPTPTEVGTTIMPITV